MLRSAGFGKFQDRFRLRRIRSGLNTRTAALSLQIAATLFFVLPQAVLAQKDPGVRGGAPGAGGPITGLTANELAMFREGIKRANQLESVCGEAQAPP